MWKKSNYFEYDAEANGKWGSSLRLPLIKVNSIQFSSHKREKSLRTLILCLKIFHLKMWTFLRNTHVTKSTIRRTENEIDKMTSGNAGRIRFCSQWNLIVSRLGRFSLHFDYFDSSRSRWCFIQAVVDVCHECLVKLNRM